MHTNIIADVSREMVRVLRDALPGRSKKLLAVGKDLLGVIGGRRNLRK